MSRLNNVAIYVIEGKRCLAKTTVAINWMRCKPNKRDVFLSVPTRDSLESYLRRHLLAQEVLIDREGPSEKPVIRKITLEELYGPAPQPASEGFKITKTGKYLCADGLMCQIGSKSARGWWTGLRADGFLLYCDDGSLVVPEEHKEGDRIVGPWTEPEKKPIDLKSLSKHDNYVVGRLSADILFERDQKAGHLREIEALEGSLKNLADKISEKKQIICGIEKAEREALEAIELLIGGAS